MLLQWRLLLQISLTIAITITAATATSPINKTISGSHLGSPPSFTSYTNYLEQEITSIKHSFLAGNNVYYISQGRWGNPGNLDDETIGLIHPFYNDLRSRGTGIVEYENTGVGNDFWGWNFHKDVEVAKGIVIGGEHTGGLDAGSDSTPSLLTNHDGTLCIATHETQMNYGLPVSMQLCNEEDERQHWKYNSTTGLFINPIKNWCLFAGRPDLIGQQLKTWGCDESNPQVIWDYDTETTPFSTKLIKSRYGYNAQYNDGKCIKSGLAINDIPTMDICDETLADRQFDLQVIQQEIRYENVSPERVYWRPDGMTMEYSIGPAPVAVREEKFISANDVVSTIIYSDIPIEIEFTGKSFALTDFRSVSKNATCEYDELNNAIHVVEGGRVLAKVSESPEVILEADLMYSGMSSVLSSSRVIQSYSQVELEAGECRYTFRLPVDSEGITLSWTMNDEYATALDAVQDVLSDPVQHKEAKTEEMNHLLNYNVPYFRAEDDAVVKVYYYLWSIFLMLYKYVGTGQEVHHHTQTAVNNFLGLHNWDAIMQINVGSWTTDKPTWAYGNVLLWSELPLTAMSSDGKVPDNMGQQWNSGLFGGNHHWQHACGAWQVYKHSGDDSFLQQSYTFFDNLATHAGGVYGESFDASICLGKMATALGLPDAEITKWNEHMDRYGGLDWYLNQRWDANRSCWLDCDENSPNGIHRWGQIGKTYESYFPDAWTRAMGEAWLTKGNEDGFYPSDGVPLVSTARRDWDKILCPGTLESMSCGDLVPDKYWSEFAVTPDTNYYMLMGMFRHNVPHIAVPATLGHLKLNNMEWGITVAPESREADFVVWGDQFSNFNAGKLIPLIEGVGGFEVSIGNSTLTQADALPQEWSFMEWRMPIRAASATDTDWVLVKVERFCSGESSVHTKQITVESNPLDELVLSPWTEGATVLSWRVLVDGQESNIQADESVGQDRLGFRFSGDDAKKKIVVSIVLQADASTDLSGISCTTTEAPTLSPTDSSTEAPSKQPSFSPTAKPGPTLIKAGSLCIAAHETQSNYGLPTSMEECDINDPRQQWTYDATSGLFTNKVKGWCLFAGRPDLVSQQLKTWGCDDTNPQMIWTFDEASSGRIKSRLGYNEQYNDGKCIKSGSSIGDIPTMALCDETQAEQQFELTASSSGTDNGPSPTTSPTTPLTVSPTEFITTPPTTAGPKLITNHDGTLCIAAHLTQNNYGLPTSMEACNLQDARQHWTYDATNGLFTNQVKGWCLFAGRPDLVGQHLKTWGCNADNPQMIWDYEISMNGRIKSRLGYNEQYNDGKCIKSGLGIGDTPTMDVCDDSLVEQHFYLTSAE